MTDLARIHPSTNIELSRGIMGLEAQMYAAAQAELDRVTDGGSFTAIEKQAMLEGEALRMTNGLELGTIIIRGKIIKRIVDRGLARQHPNQYASYREMASDCGLSHSELSKTENLVNVVFPGLEALGYNIPHLWEEIGKTNFMDLIPYFRILMTGEASNSQAANNAVEALLNDIHATAQSVGREISEEDAVREAIDQLIENGAHLTNAELRRQVRREPTPSIEATFIRTNGRRLVIADVDEDQYQMLNRLLGPHVDPQLYELPEEPTARMLEAAQIPAIVRVADLIAVTR